MSKNFSINDAIVAVQKANDIREHESGLQMALKEIAMLARGGENDIRHLQYLNHKYNLGLGGDRDLADRIAETTLKYIKNALPRE